MKNVIHFILLFILFIVENYVDTYIVVYGKRTLLVRSVLCEYPIYGKRTLLSIIVWIPEVYLQIGHTYVFISVTA